MNYAKVIESLNEELEQNGIKTIYALIANNLDIDAIKSIVEKNTSEYAKLSKSEKEDLFKYIKSLRAQSKLIGIF